MTNMINQSSNYLKPVREWRSSLQIRLTMMMVLAAAAVLVASSIFFQVPWVASGIIVVAIALLSWLVIGRTLQPIKQLTESSTALGSGEFNRRVRFESHDELGGLAQAFNGMADQVEDVITKLEARISEQTSLLEQRTYRMKAASDVSRSITILEKLDVLLTNAARLISEKFSFYHIGIFLLDENHEYAVLRASNSEGGQRLLAKFHRLKIGETGIVGHTALSVVPRIASDVGLDAVFFNNPELPLTRSEMALPIVIDAELLGVLDIQSTEPQAFLPEDMDALQVLADQLAISIRNARLFEQNLLALAASTRIYDQSSRDSWIQLLSGWSRAGYLATSQGTLQRVSGIWDKELSESIESGVSVMSDDGFTISTPLKVRGQVIGAIRLKKPESSTNWEKEDTNLALAFAEQLSAAIDSARLYADAQMRAARESLISDISMRVSSTPLISAIVGETAKELGQAIGNTSVVFQLINPAGELASDSYASEDVGLREIRRYVNDGNQTGYMYQSRGKLIEAPALQGAGWTSVIESGTTVSLAEKTRDDFPFIAVPLKLRDQIIGLIQIRAEQPVREWKESEINLVQSIADRSVIAIENASLLAESQRRALKEKTIGEISAKISSMVDVDNIVQTALQELSRTLPDADMEIQFHQLPG
jgi:GAF domain-containing protein/HAMP domain-containing protein